MVPSPFFALGGTHGSSEQTPVMGSCDALLPGCITPANKRSFNGLPPSVQRTIITRSGHPHTIVFEGDDGADLNPSQIFPHRNFV